jgi:serine phosphatase RsbU (regulator of sigma subunit)
MHCGDVLVIASDGVREALDSDGRMFGPARIGQALLEHCNLPARELAERLRAAVMEHQGENPSAGQAVLVLKRRG